MGQGPEDFRLIRCGPAYIPAARVPYIRNRFGFDRRGESIRSPAIFGFSGTTGGGLPDIRTRAGKLWRKFINTFQFVCSLFTVCSKIPCIIQSVKRITERHDRAYRPRESLQFVRIDFHTSLYFLHFSQKVKPPVSGGFIFFAVLGIDSGETRCYDVRQYYFLGGKKI